MSIDGALAFAEYDQRATYPPDTTLYETRHYRVLVKRDGVWRLLSAGVFNTASFAAAPRAIEDRLNAVGATLLGAKKATDALEVFMLNARMNPVSPRVHQSLGDAYAAAGETRLAIQSYERALALDSKNDASKVALAKLREKKSPQR